MKLAELPKIEYWDEYDWEQVLGQPAEYYAKNGPAEPVQAEDIKHVVWLTADSPEGYGSVDMAAVVELVDGQFAICEAWADTTGWGCRDGVTWKVVPTLLMAASELSPEYAAQFDAAMGE